MIIIDREAKQIVFQNEYSESETPKPIHRKDLISCYVCPKCNEIITAYFKTEAYILVWEYDETSDKESYKSDLRHYKYRIFYTHGAMGIENKEHNNSYQPKCSFRYVEALHLLYGINGIIKVLNKQFDEEVFKPIEQIKSKEELLKRLAANPIIELVHDVCERGYPLIHLNINEISFEETHYWKYKGIVYEKRKKQEQKNKLKAFDSIYSMMQC